MMELSIDQLKELLCGNVSSKGPPEHNNGMIGTYVIVRCRDAGVHAGWLQWHNGRECGLKDSRRLWYWKPANGAKFLSGVATEGLHADSKLGAAVDIHLTENCEIIRCTGKAAASIQDHSDDKN